MPCHDSSSGLNIRLTLDERLIEFEFAKITCSSEIGGQTGLSAYCKGKPIQAILDLDHVVLCSALNLNGNEESMYIMFLELNALKAGIAQFLGVEHDTIDSERCLISSILYNHDYIEISEVVLPPKEMPKILPCNKTG